MAKLGTLSMDTGSDGSGRPTAVAFWLKTNPGFNVQVSPLGSDWEVELQQNQDAVVARCNAALNSADALRGGREAVEEALDRVCFRFNDPLEVKLAEESHLILTTDGGKNELTYNMAAPLEVRLRPIEATVIDKYGTTQTQGTTPMTWMPVLRYYRLSQTRDDIFDAYRYMFLAFEALLHGLYPIKRKERERDWMLRALAKVAKKVSLGRFISGAATDPVRAFIDGQYGNVRLRLFHAKKSSQTQPHEGIPEADVARAYSDLTRFCREVHSPLGNFAIGVLPG
jgi:hypothetical protein